MKEEITLRAEGRAQTGKGAARRMRRDGFVPAVVYGHGRESVHLRIRADELDGVLSRIRAGTTMIGLKIDGGGSRKVLIRELQRHPFRSDILHVDFFQIREDERIRVAVPLRLIGQAQGVEEGGILQQLRHEIQVECLPSDIPESFELDVTALLIGDSLHVADFDAGGVTVLDDLDLTVCAVVPPTVMKVEEEEEELEEIEAEAEAEAEVAEEEPGSSGEESRGAS